MTTELIAIKNNVIFQFVEDVISNRFVNSTESGLIVSSLDGNQSGLPRWGVVVSIGEDVDGIEPGDNILIEPGKWTPGFFVDGKRYWKTDDDKVMCISDEPLTTY